ncbi:hypothetical protein HDG34_005895 [Paraburkholderia sp. HC6.4b]|uniref:hypothetical protein n=1 Tax=unclassified Paraburkholderia TaxID=2615204 RepID=UPI001619097C|nr:MULTISPECIES: hypothetical protein [unclassified Paraburkholderia]MBB5411929.1 hypothetical protein [Paraburkholderia sp. HC6.4b]MBB5450241.1 hypothetical protein [Paraburkholderia sp. Kb1A]
MKAKLDAMMHHAGHVESACHDMESAAHALESMRDTCTPENQLECCMYTLLEEMVDAQAATMRLLVAMSHAMHHHMVIYHGAEAETHHMPTTHPVRA